MQPPEIADVQPTFEQTVLFFALLAGIALGFINMFRLFATMITHRTLRKAIETNPQMAEALLAKLTARREGAGDDRIAIILIAIGIAMAVGPLIAVDDRGMIRLFIAASLFPLLIGGALWLRFRAVERAKRRDRAE
jgi:hypothetical protein